MNITDRINHGLDVLGAEWVMWLLLLLSVLSVACIVERWLFLRKRKIDLASMWQTIQAHLDANDPDKITADLKNAQSMEEVVSLSLLQERSQSAEALQDHAQAHIDAERLRYNRRLSFLATTASNAPFIGLLGTVVGIVQAFGDLTEAVPGQNRSVLIMGSLSEALAATAIGLIVAIPAAAAYNWFQGQVDDCETRAQILTRRIIARLR